MARMTRRKFLKIAGLGSLGITTTGCGTLFYGNQIELFNFEVVERELVLSRLADSFDGYRVGHISDIHHDGVYMDRQLNSCH